MPAVRYTSDPTTGAYTFFDENDRGRVAYGPDAKELASWIDRTRPQQLASNEGMMGAGGAVDWGQTAQSSRDVAREALDVPRPSPVAEAAAPPPAPMRPAAPQPTPQVQPTDVLEQPYEGAFGSRDRDLAYILRPRAVGGRPAFDPEAEAAARRPVPVQQTTTIAGALPETAEEREQRVAGERERAQLVDDARVAATSRMELEQATNEQAAAQARVDAFNTQSELKDAQQREAEMERLFQADMARLEGERRAVAGMKVDPRRLFKGKPGLQIGTAIAVALGAFGAAMAGTRNFALDIVEGTLQNDIDAQMDEIQRRGSSAENAIADVSRRYQISVGEARHVVERLQREHAAALSAQTAAQIGTAQALQQHQQFLSDLAQKNALTEAKLREAHKGRINTTTASTMMAPRKATGGGYRPPTPQEIKQGAEAVTAVRKATGQAQDPAELRAMAEQRKAATEERKAELETDKRISEYGDKRMKNESALGAIERIVSAAGASLDKDSGKIKMPEGDIPGLGLTGKNPGPIPDYPYTGLSDEGKNVRDAYEGAQMVIGLALSGAAVSQQEREKISRMIGEARTDEEAMRALEYSYRVVKDNNDKLGGSYGPEVAKEYERRMQEEQRRRQKNAEGGPNVEPY